MRITRHLEGHPPTFAAAASALVAAVVADVLPTIDWGPLTDDTVTLIGVGVVGVLGGAIGKLAERWTTPWRPPDHEAGAQR